MNEGLYGIIGVVVGGFLSVITTLLLDTYNRSKDLYIDVDKAIFNYYFGQYAEEPLEGSISLYIYNDSSLPKMFLLDRVILEGSEISFQVTEKSSDEKRTDFIYPIAPNDGIKLIWKLSVTPNIDFQIPNIEGRSLKLSYRSGKKIRSMTVPLIYSSPV